MKWSQRLLAVVAAVSIVGVSSFVGIDTTQATAPQYVSTSITPVMGTVYSGDPLGYILQAQCSNPVGCGTVVLTVPAPPAWQPSFGSPTVALSPQQVAAGVTYVALANGTIELTWPNALTGNSLYAEMDWPTQNYNTIPGPQPMTVSTTTTGEPGTAATSSTINQLVAAPAISMYKGGPTSSYPGGLVTYEIVPGNDQSNPTTAQGGLSVVAVTTDVLPAGVTFISCSQSCTYNATANSVTWPAVTLPRGWNPYTITYQLPATAVNGDSFTNTATVVGAPLGGGPPVTASAAVTTVVVVGVPQLASTFTKEADLPSVNQPGGISVYRLKLTNDSNVPVDAVLTDVFPTGYDVRFASLTNVSDAQFTLYPITFTVTYNDGTTQQWVNPDGVDVSVFGKRVVSLAVTGVLPPYSTINPVFHGVIVAAPGTILHNCADSTIRYPGQPDVIHAACADVRVAQAVTYADISKVAKQITPVAVGGTVDWVLSLMDDIWHNSAVRTQPQIIDLVPTNLTYVDGSFAIDPLNPATCPVLADFAVSVVPNYRDGRTAVIATTAPAAGGSGATLPLSTTCKYTISTTVNDATPAGVYGGATGTYPIASTYQGNEAYLFDTRGYQVTGTPDSADIDQDGDITEFTQGATANFSVAQAAALKVVKWVQGDQDAAFIGSAEQDPSWFGTSSVGGTVDWKVQLGNSGNMPMNKLVAYDLLPAPANKGVTGSRYTDSGDVNQWVPTMTGPIAHGAEVTTSYSTNPNPCRPEMDSTLALPIYCSGNYQQNSDWVAEGAVADWSKVRAIRFDFGAAAIAGGRYYTYTWQMRVPATMADGSPLVDGATAWNKIAASGYTDIFSATPKPLLPTEAAWVEDIIHIAKPVSVGDYVFVDVNRDGLQDATDLPVAGVTATLYAADGTTLVAVDNDGAPVVPLLTDVTGHYVFLNLPAGSYVVKFTTVPADYSPTASADTVGVALDSNGLTATSVVIAPGGSDMTLDLGLVSLDLTVAKSLTSTGPFYPGSTVVFSLVPHNNGPVNALAGWSVTEVLPAGLTLVSMTGTGYTCAAVACTATAGLAAGVDGPVITVTATMNAGVTTMQHNVAFITPGPGETTETNPLVVPTTTTDTSTTTTNNDSQADVSVGIVVAVGDYTWIDADHNGIQDAGELPLAGVTVTLQNADGTPATHVDGTPVIPATTDALGHYLFDNLLPGSYQITFTPPAGFLTTVLNAGGTTTDSDAVASGPTAAFTVSAIATGNTRAVTAADGTTLASLINPTIDGGFFQPVSVGDYVFIDVNRDGLQDATDIPLAGVTATLFAADGITPVTVDANGDPLGPLVTDAAGHYQFTNLFPGGYVVKFSTIPTGFSPTTSTDTVGVSNDSNGLTATSAVLMSGAADPTLDVGLVSLNLLLTKSLVTTGIVRPGDTVVFILVPHNNGPVNALAGWSVTEIMPSGLTLVSMTGTGYTCAGVTCTSTTTLSAGADGASITVTAAVAAGTTTGQHNVAYITPARGETNETNPLVVPTTTSDTASSATDNDAGADVTIEAIVVAPPTPSTPSTLSPATKIPVTGSDTRQQLTTSLALLALGLTLLAFSRRRNRHIAN